MSVSLHLVSTFMSHPPTKGMFIIPEIWLRAVCYVYSGLFTKPSGPKLHLTGAPEFHRAMRFFLTAWNSVTCHMSTTCLALPHHDVMPSSWRAKKNLNVKVFSILKLQNYFITMAPLQQVKPFPWCVGPESHPDLYSAFVKKLHHYVMALWACYDADQPD